MNILLVFNPQEAKMGDMVADELASRMGSDTLIDSASNALEALNFIRKRPYVYDLLVITSALAPDRNSTVLNEFGLDLSVDIRKLGKEMPIVVLAPKITTQIATRCATLSPPVPVVDDPTAIAELAQGLLQRSQSSRVDPSLNIRVIAETHGWRYEMKGEGFDYEARGDLHVPKSAWMCWTDFHASPTHWYLDFAKIGNSIRTCLCEENSHFEKHREIGLMMAKARHQDKPIDTRLMFLVAKEHYRLVLEAIFDPQLPEPWMVNAQMMRHLSLSGRTPRGPIFRSSSSPPKALLICADTSGTFADPRIPGGSVTLAALENVQRECEQVRALLRTPSASGQLWFGKDDIHELGGAGKPFTKDDLLKKLANGPWDIIHFAGHSCFFAPDQGAESGYVFIDGPNRTPLGIKFNELAPYFRDAGFLYLSSCESGNSSFFVEASAAGVNTMMGYRWKVNDTAARIQANAFYANLLKSLSVGTAFRDTRRAMYQRYAQNESIWASAMLVTAET
jgi:hypothetical protein